MEDADVVKDRYRLRGKRVSDSSKGLAVFRDSYERFKSRIRSNQTEKSTWMVTRWAIHDNAQFEAIVSKISGLLDGLEGISNSLGLLHQRQALLTREIESIRDVQSLRLLRDATSSRSASSSQRAISDAASQRLSLFESAYSRSRLASSDATRRSASFFTASSRSHPSSSLATRFEHGFIRESVLPTRDRDEDGYVQRNKGRYQSMRFPWNISSRRSARDRPVRGPTNKVYQPQQEINNVPQNKRVVASLLRDHSASLPSPSFASGAAVYGNSLRAIKTADANTWQGKSVGLLVNAEAGATGARRMFLELRSIRRAAIPFISAAPIGDSLDKVLASIEGPPDTPYAGGIFWISVHITDINSCKPPLLRFLTRVYHPNIDCNGNICADYKTWWDDPDLSWYMKIDLDASGPWFSERRGNHFSLGAVLTSLCGLLASPVVDDPLVPEIAEKYISDYEGYCAAAQLYTEKYAVGRR